MCNPSTFFINKYGSALLLYNKYNKGAFSIGLKSQKKYL